MKKLTCLMSLIFTLLTIGCATLAPVEERRIEYIETTKATKTDAYNKAMSRLAKFFVDANKAIQMRNAESGQIIATTSVECNVLRQTGDINTYVLHFNFEFQAKDNKVRMKFEDLEMKGSDGRPLAFATNQITSKEKVESIKVCLEPIRTSIMSEINGQTKNDNW